MVAFITQTAERVTLANNSHPTPNVQLALFGGGGIGLLFGVIMGTTTTPTIATLLGALTAVLGAILGLNDNLFSDTKAARIGAFGVCCVVGAYLGLYVRSHNLLSPSLIELKHGYLAAGFSEQQAMQILAMKEVGVSLQSLASQAISVQKPLTQEPLAQKPLAQKHSKQVLLTQDPSAQRVSTNLSSTKAQSATAAETTSAQHLFKQHGSLLFSAPVTVTGCDELRHTDATLALDEISNNFELTGGAWAQLGAFSQDNVRESEQKPFLLIVKNTVCELLQPNPKGEGNIQTAGGLPLLSDLQAQCRDTQGWLQQGNAQLIAADHTQTKDLLSRLAPSWAALAQQLHAADLTTRSSQQAFERIHQLLCEEEH